MLKIAFWGTPELTTVYLDALASSGMLPEVIITNPDRPKGRGHELAPTPAKIWAKNHDIPVMQPEKLDDHFYSHLEVLKLDVSIVVAYGSIMPQRFIDLPKYKTLNVHYSLLPKYRGAAPTESAILNGDTETGSAIQIMARKLDSGPIIALEKTPIGEDENTTMLRGRLTEIGAALLVRTLPEYVAGNITPTPQDDSQATHSGKIKKEDGLLDLSDDPIQNYRKYKAYYEWPRTYFFATQYGAEVRVIIKKAHFENGKFVIDRVLAEGKKEVSYTDFKKNFL